MQRQIKNLFGPGRVSLAVSFLFFAGFFLFLRFCIETDLIDYYYQMCRKTPIFKTGWLFLRDYLAFPGGQTQYIASYLTQLCYFPWIGAVAITLLAWGIYRCTASLTAVPSDSPWRVVCFVPAILVLMIWGRYENPLTVCAAVLVAAFFAVLYQKVSPHIRITRVILFLFFSGIIYYVAGSAVLVFIVPAALYEFFSRRKPALSAIYLFLGPAVCWFLGAFFFKLDDSDLYVSAFPFVPIKQILEKENRSRIFEWALFAFIPAIVFLTGVSGFDPFDKLRAGKLTTGRLAVKKAIAEKITVDVPSWIVQAALLFIIAVPAVLLCYDYKAKRTIQVSYFASRRMWPEVLDVARKGSLKRYFPLCSNAVNRALYYTGRLGDEMFNYPQEHRSSELVLYHFMRRNIISISMGQAEVCLDVGMVNVAEETARQFLAGTDDSPYILKQLALINIVKGQIETAKVYLRALTKNPAYRAESRDLLRRLETDPRLDSDRRIQELRSIMINEDIAYAVYDEGYWLEGLLRTNKHNKMAFEYLMAYYLITRNLDKFIENLPRLDDFGYKEIPRHYQEAILLYIGITRKDVDLGQRGINVEVKNKYDEINQLGQNLGNNAELLKKVLMPKFSNTYFFYFTFGFSEPVK